MNYKSINDYEVLYMIRENSEEAKDLMYEKYMPIVKKMASAFYASNKNLGVEYEDYIQEGMIALNKAINTYNEKKDVLFFTYFNSVINKHFNSYIRALKANKHTVLNQSIRYSEIFYNVLDEKNSNYVGNMVEEEFTEMKNFLDFKFSVLFELRYNGFTYKEISKLLDIPVGTVQSRIKKMRRILQNKFQKAI